MTLAGTVADPAAPGAAALDATSGVTALTEGLPLGVVHLAPSASTAG